MGRKLTDANRLLLRYPKVAAQWHPVKNGSLTPHDVTYASNIKRWWTCKRDENHEWEDSPNHRTAGRGCPFCAGKRVADSNRLSTNYPQLAREWHPKRNGELTPGALTVASGKKVWWICSQDRDHEWDAVVASRTKMGVGCPFCAGKRVTDVNRLSILFPDVAKEWHPTKNGKLTPADVSYGSNKPRSWLCEAGHEWETVVCYRTLDGTGCPYCAGKRVTDANRLSTLYPDVAKEWHPIRNGDLKPDDVHYSSNKKVRWICSQDRNHEWDAPPNARTAGSGCPFCAGKRVADSNRLSTNYPHLVAEWHPTENGDLTPDNVTSGSNRKVRWRCEEGHAWYAVIVSRVTGGHGCPYCSGLKVSDANRLSIKSPEVAKEWHPTKNGILTPHDVAVASNRPVWWVCERGHEWEAVIPGRTRLGNGCPYCSGLRVTDDNRLSLKYPELVKEWHPCKNGDLKPEDVSYGSGRKVWWVCERGHEWDADVGSRANNGAGCPCCSGLRVTDDNRLSLKYPELVKEWHPCKNSDLKPEDVSYGSSRKVWWRCERRHEWEAVISSRSDGNGCRNCTPTHRSKPEIYLACELAKFFDDVDPTQTHTISVPVGRPKDVDICIPSRELIIEYDGAHWHKDKLGVDKKKTQELQKAGWDVLRIREEPLELVQTSDLRCPVTYNNHKDLIDRVLIHLKEELGIEMPGVDVYLNRETLLNEALADEIMGKERARRERIASIQPDPATQLDLLQDS